MNSTSKSIKLSICIATFNRGKFIGETLDSILPQLTEETELLVVDGASPDNTFEVLTEYQKKYPQIRYIREKTNSGVDQDYDKAVGYALGKFCWLMTDDDLLYPGAITKVLSQINSDKYDLIIANAELRTTQLDGVLDSNRLNLFSDKTFSKSTNQDFFKEMTSFLSFIGCVVIRKEFWDRRNRSNYYGSCFVHVGVIFQNPPLNDVYVISEPLIIIRHGNSLWTPRSFEIWNFKWQKLIWSMTDYSDEQKTLICHKEPWRRFKTLLYARAMGSYNLSECKRLLSHKLTKKELYGAYAAALFPLGLANFIVVTYFVLLQRTAKLAIYDLIHTKSASIVSKVLTQMIYPLKIKKIQNDQ